MSNSENDMDSANSANSRTKKGKKGSAIQKNGKEIPLKNSGKTYVSHTGKTVQARKMRSPCPKHCTLGCSNKFSDDQRQTLFNDY